MASEESSVRYRNRYEIIAKILSGFDEKKPRTKTAIMYDGRLAWDQTHYYINILLRSDFITVSTKKRYQITAKGKSWLEQYQKMPQLLTEV